MASTPDEIINPTGKLRVVVTKDMPGPRWREILVAADCRIELYKGVDILTQDHIKAMIGDGHVDAVIGQLTEKWDAHLLEFIAKRGAKVYSQMAVGYNNVDVAAATKFGLPVGNTPGVLTETTAEMAISLTFAAMRRVVEADTFMRSGKFIGWLPTMFLGKLAYHGTVGVIGCGRIGGWYCRQMAEGMKMNIVYHDLYPNTQLEKYMQDYNELLKKHGEKPLTCRRVDTVEEVLRTADIVSLHPILDPSTKHLINAQRLAIMKKDAILVNSARGPVIDEKALVAHLRANPDFRVGLDVYEEEPQMAPGLAECPNAVIVPHIASATMWTRSGMATLAAANAAGILKGLPLGDQKGASLPYLEGPVPDKTPFIVNWKELSLK